jgi:hypothetical protein
VTEPSVAQHADAHRDAYIVGSGALTQNRFNLYLGISDESVARLLPDLVRLLTDRPEAIPAIREAAGHAQPPAGFDLAGVLAWLAQLVPDVPAELPPPLLVSELARQRATDAVAREAFGAIAEKWAAEVPGGQRRLDDFRGSAGLAGQRGGEPCLVVLLDPDRNGGDGYRLSVKLFGNGRGGEPQPGEDTLLSLDEIRARLGERLPSLIRTVDGSSLLLEFVVPRHLLHADVDQWLIPERPGGSPPRSYRLGSRHAVVVRDLERMSPLDDRSMWRKRWRRLCECTDPAPGAVRWVRPREGHSYESMAASLLREQAHGQVCLALLAAPSAGTSAAELLEAALTAGVPAAVWLRQPASEDEDDERYLTIAVESAALRSLPRQVLDMRQAAEEARQDAAQRGRNLSLLWDNPDRTWEPQPFTVPAPLVNGAV